MCIYVCLFVVYLIVRNLRLWFNYSILLLIGGLNSENCG